MYRTELGTGEWRSGAKKEALSSLLGTARDEAGGSRATGWEPQEPAALVCGTQATAAQLMLLTVGWLCRGPSDWPGLRAAELSGEAGLL